MAANSDAPGARILAGSLRQVREATGLSLRELGHKVDISYSVLSYWENARRVPDSEDVATVLAALGVTGEQRAAILQLARNAQAPNHLAVGTPGVSEQLNGVLECERTASAITDWSLALIPGLLQTSAYTRCVLYGGGWEPGPRTEHQVIVRAGRRDALTRTSPITLDAMIGEAALRQHIGSNDLMAEQLRHLLTMSDLPTVTLRIVPNHSDYHPGLAGPFVMYEFETAPPIVHMEHHRTGAFVFDADDVAQYKLAVDSIREQAMSPKDSAGLIATIASEKESTR